MRESPMREPGRLGERQSTMGGLSTLRSALRTFGWIDSRRDEVLQTTHRSLPGELPAGSDATRTSFLVIGTGETQAYGSVDAPQGHGVGQRRRGAVARSGRDA
jgi:hypothetical protein